MSNVRAMASTPTFTAESDGVSVRAIDHPSNEVGH